MVVLPKLPRITLSVPSHPIIVSIRGSGSKRRQTRQASSCLQGGPSRPGPQLRTVASVPDGSCDEHPRQHLSEMLPHQSEWGGGGIYPSPGGEGERGKSLSGRRWIVAVQLQLEISSSNGGFEAIQTWRKPHGSWGADTELRHSMVPVVYVHLSVEELTQAGSSKERAQNHLTFPHNSLEL